MNFQTDDRLEPGMSGDGLLRDRGHEVEIIKARWKMGTGAESSTTKYTKAHESRLWIARGVQVLVHRNFKKDEFGTFGVVYS